MIKIVPTDHLLGISLQGDYDDLNELYDGTANYFDFYSAFTDRPYDDCEYLLGLNYDIRHAYQGSRDLIAVENNFQGYELIRASKDPGAELDDVDRRDVKWMKKTFTDYNLYFSVDIAVPIALYYVWFFQNILDDYYQESWFDKYNKEHHGVTYSPLQAEHDLTQIRLFNAAMWDYLEALLGEEDAGTLFHYASHNEEGTVFYHMYIQSILSYFVANGQKLTEDLRKEFIIYIFYCVMDPVSVRYTDKSMLPCHNQFERVKNSLKGKLTEELPSYSRFVEFEKQYFGDKKQVGNFDFGLFIDKYFGHVDWESVEW